MLFYHFTTISYLRPDLTPGTVNAADLPPLTRGDDLGLPQLAGGPLVGLTTDRASWVDGDVRCVRITIKLPRDDHRLKQWLPWGRKTLGPDFMENVIADVARMFGVGNDVIGDRLSHWWLFRKVIPPARFEAIEILHGKPWWLVPV